MASEGDPPADAWDQAFADELVGRLILIGCTYLDPAGEVAKQEQMFGTVSWVDARRGIEVSLEGQREGEIWRMPPDLRSVSRAQPGIYRLRSTGEAIENPAFLANWTINARPDS